MKWLFLLLVPACLFGQTYGPNSPAVGANVAVIGTLPWLYPNTVLLSDNASSSESTKGITHYLQGNGFNFSLPNTDIISGIRLEVEKSSTLVQDVALSGTWTVGTTRPALAAGVNRCLIVVISLENATARDITSVTYGGKTMLPLAEIGQGNPIFFARTEVWYLLESDLATTVGTTISYTFGLSIPSENFEIVASALYTNVDQLFPFNDIGISSTASTSSTFQLAQPINNLVGSMAVTAIFCGNPPAGSQPLGPCTGYSINSGFTEQVDVHGANTSGFSTSGGVLEIAQRPSIAVNTVQPTFTFNGTPNRQTAVGFSLRRARQLDNSVRLRKSFGIVGIDHSSLLEWPTTDAYTSYGGLLDLWGSTWFPSEINDPGFGAVISALVQNGTATVDHMRITIFTITLLPVELVSFTAIREGNTVRCDWLTASERDLDSYVVERSADGLAFVPIGTVKAIGNTQEAHMYSLVDEHPKLGTNYYRLKTMDINGTVTYSDIVYQEFTPVIVTGIYPNPTTEWTKVMTSNGFDEIVITDMQGRIIDRFAGTNAPTQELNLYDHPDGAYYICIRKGEAIEIKKLMKTSRSSGE